MTKEPQIGRRYTMCCCVDAEVIETEEDLECILEEQREREEDSYTWYLFFPTKEELKRDACSCPWWICEIL